MCPPGVMRMEKKASLGLLANVIGFHLAQASVVTDASFRALIGVPLALRKVEFSLLMLLLDNGPMAPKQLARMLALSAPNLTLQLDRLAERGLVQREPNPLDGRSQHIVLSSKGAQLAGKAVRAAASLEATLLQRLSTSEHATLITLLAKLVNPGIRKLDRSK